MIEPISTVWSVVDYSLKLYYLIESDFITPCEKLRRAFDRAFNKAWGDYCPHDQGEISNDIEKRRLKRDIISVIERGHENDLTDDVKKIIRLFQLRCAEDELIYRVTTMEQQKNLVGTLNQAIENKGIICEQIIQQTLDEINEKPFRPIKDSLEKLYADHSYIDSGYLIDLRKELVAEKMPIRLLALSGMGKTRLIFETFKEPKYRCFYADEAESDGLKEAIKSIANRVDKPIIIVDNCPFETHCELIRLHESYTREFKLVTINHDYDDNEASKTKVIVWYKEHFKELLIDHINKQNIEERERRLILELSDYNPQLVLTFLQSDREENYKITDEYSFFKRLIHIDPSTDRHYYSEILEMIALFKPISYYANDLTTSSEIKWLAQSSNLRKICNIAETDIVVEYIEDTIAKYSKKKIIEKNDFFINVRPLPLAFWLIKQWQKRNPNALAKLIKNLESSELEGSDQLLNALSRRFLQMEYVSNGIEWIGDLFENENSLFGSAERLFTRLGSMFLRSSLNVVPDSTFKALERCFKEIDMNKFHNLDDIIKSNLRYSIHFFCVEHGKETQAIRLMAQLASCEPDTYYSNNAKQAFYELFRPILSGTTLNLKLRVELMREIAYTNEFLPLLPELFRVALTTQNLIRLQQQRLANGKPVRDNEPTNEEFNTYISKTWLLLVELVDLKVLSQQQGLEILKDKMQESLAVKIYKPVYDAFDKMLSNNILWEKIRTDLKHFLSSHKVDTANETLIQSWIDRMNSKLPYTLLTDFSFFCQRGVRNCGGNYEENHKICIEKAQLVARELQEIGWYTQATIEYLYEAPYLGPYGVFNKLGKLHKDSLKEARIVIETAIKVVDNKPDHQIRNLLWLKEYMIGVNCMEIILEYIPIFKDKGMYFLVFELMGAMEKNCDYVYSVINDISTNINLEHNSIMHYINEINDVDLAINLIEIIIDNDHKYSLVLLDYTQSIISRYFSKNETNKTLESFCAKTLLASIPLSIRESYSLQEILKWLLKHDSDFGATFIDKVIEFNREKTESMIKKYPESLLNIIGQNNPNVLWPLVEYIYTNEDASVFYNGITIDKNFVTSSTSGALFSHLDTDRLFELASKFHNTAASCLVYEFPLFEIDNKDKMELHPLQLRIIKELSHGDGVLETLSSRLHEYSCWGSPLPLYEARRRVMEDLVDNSDEMISEFAKEQVKEFNYSIKQEKMRDAYRAL